MNSLDNETLIFLLDLSPLINLCMLLPFSVLLVDGVLLLDLLFNDLDLVNFLSELLDEESLLIIPISELSVERSIFSTLEGLRLGLILNE